MNAIVEPLRPARRSAAATVESAERLSRSAALLRALTAALLAGVQRTTELNWQSARLLLACRPLADWRANADRAVESWRMSWRSYQVCSVTASDVLDLVSAQIEAESDDLWRALRPFAVDGDSAQSAPLHASLQQVQSSFAAYLQAVLVLQRELAALAQGDE